MRERTLTIDFDNDESKRMLFGHLKILCGIQKIKIKPLKRNRTGNQNAWYWGCVVPTVQGGLEEAWGEYLTPEEVHEWLKMEFCSTPIVNRTTGRVMGSRPKSTANLDTSEFSEYCEKVIRFCAEQFGLEVPTPLNA